jgi:sortase (surface protein transpeptidase)
MANQSGCNPDASEAVLSLVIPDIAYTCPVYAGGQAMIDAGFVTLVTDAGISPVLATNPGEPGTLWLAGHRSTHGAAFAMVPDLADGALITVSADGATARYRVVGRASFEVRGDRVIDASGAPTAEATWASVIRDDLSGNLAPRLVLQTCEGDDFRVMIYADLVT